MWVPTKKRRVEDQLRPNLRVKKASSVQNGYLPTEDSEVLQGQSAIKKLDRAEPELLLLTMTGQQWTLSQSLTLPPIFDLMKQPSLKQLIL